MSAKTSVVLVPMRPDPYRVHIGSGLIERLPALLASRFPARRAVVVTDARLAATLGRRVAGSLERSGWRADRLSLPSGEAAKSFSALIRLYGALLRLKVERRTPLIAVGGGAVGDAAGFAAATFYRGIPLVHVPSTLLAQVDSAIGGKTAVNHPLAKNAVGAFYQPALTIADLSALAPLPERDFLSGLAEVVKYALVFDKAFARRLESDWPGILSRKPATLLPMIRRCVELKAAVVAQDERDLTGRRELLNFGHTLGHALESSTGYRFFRHGEAVAWGMRAAVALSRARGWLSVPNTLALADSLLTRLPARAWPAGLRPAALLKALAGDKKIAGAKNVFILLRGLADPVRVDDVSPAEILAALERLR